MSTGPDRPAPLTAGDPHRLVAFSAARRHTLGELQAHARGLAGWLPEGNAIVNLCEDRYRFLALLCAGALRGQQTLLPSARTPDAIAQALALHGPGHVLIDAAASAPAGALPLPHPLPAAGGAAPSAVAQAPLLTGFTSGSTGVPQAHTKTLAMFTRSTAQNLAALRTLWPAGEQAHAVATVPSQHMYGMELTAMLPLLGDVAIHVGRPLLPEEVLAALNHAPAPRLLVTTPVHLSMLLRTRMAWPAVAGIVCSTAPLSQALAETAEVRFDCPVIEFFGSTETLITASRRTAATETWSPLQGVRFQAEADRTTVHAAHLPVPVTIADVIHPEAGGGFTLRGRHADMIDIAGKRASLGDITARLLAIAGVHDAVVVQMPQTGSVQRVGALVVAPQLTEADIRAQLRRALDPVFLPRPLRCVPALPRNDTGKLPRERVLALLAGTDTRTPTRAGPITPP